MAQFELYTDGSYNGNMGIGIVACKDDKPIIQYCKKFKGGSNNKAELLAIIIALKFVKKPIDSLSIISDSQYCIGCITLGWKRKANTRLWLIFDEELNRVRQLCENIEFKHILGHQKEDNWNNVADRLATFATKMI